MSRERKKMQGQSQPSEAEPFISSENHSRQVVQTTYSGPLPTSSELAKYEDIVPGSADRIIRMAELYAEHQLSMECKTIEYTRKESLTGQILGAILVVVILSVCVVALLHGFEKFATTVGSWTIISLAIVFVTGKVPNWYRDFQDKTD